MDTILEFAISVVAVGIANFFVFRSLKREKEFISFTAGEELEAKANAFFEKEYRLKVKKRYTHDTIRAADYRFD